MVIEKKLNSPTILIKIIVSRNCLNFLLCSFIVVSSVMLAANVLQLQEVGDFGDENCLPPLSLIRSTKLQLTTEPPISCRCCYMPFFFLCRPYFSDLVIQILTSLLNLFFVPNWLVLKVSVEYDC